MQHRQFFKRLAHTNCICAPIKAEQHRLVNGGAAMRFRVLFVSLYALGVAGCSSWLSSGNLGSVQLDSTPPGATATSSLGPSCQTPCSMPVTGNSEFTVTFSQPGYLPKTVNVVPQESGNPINRMLGDGTSFSPNPVIAQLDAAPQEPTKRKRANKKEKTAER
jgi:hypothetical protein